MSQGRRFFSDEPITGAEATLAGPEAHHLLHVIRMKPGEEARLFDNSGAEFQARLVRAGRREATFEIISRSEPAREPRSAVTVACALPRGPRADFLVEKCCELGAAGFIPLWCARSVVDPRVRPENRAAKWRRTAIEASKQCGRTRLTRILPPAAFSELVADSGGYDARWLCSPGGGPLPKAQTGESHLVVVGPEGGFSDDETAAALAAAMSAADLGPTVLRVETAAVVALARLLSP